MTIQITAIAMGENPGKNAHESIELFSWVDANGRSGSSTLGELFAWLRQSEQNRAFMAGLDGERVYVARRTSAAGTRFVQARVGYKFTDALLKLPKVQPRHRSPLGGAA